MSFWRATPEHQDRVKFWLECLKGLTVITAALGVLLTYWSYQDTRTRDLKKPYDVQQLKAFVKASAFMGRYGGSGGDNELSQFWEIYFGELPFFATPEMMEVATEFCKAQYAQSSCFPANDQDRHSPDPKRAMALAKRFIELASHAIRSRWDEQ